MLTSAQDGVRLPIVTNRNNVDRHRFVSTLVVPTVLELAELFALLFIQAVEKV